MKNLKTKNKWASLTKAEKRVAIAKDVLKYVGKGKFEAQAGSYYHDTDLCSSFSRLTDNNSDKAVELQKVLQKTNSCTVCAKGALLFSDIMRKNECKISQSEFSGKLEPSFIQERLKKDWSIKQINLIEIAFEQRNKYYENGGNPNRELAIRAENYACENELIYDEDILISIMKNIIKNKGTFKP